MRWPRRSPLLALVLLVPAVLLVGCRRPMKNAGEDAGDGGETGPRGTLTLKGSDTLVLLGQRWAEHFMKAHPGAHLQVTGGGSGTGIAALINGTTDIALSSRPLDEAETQRLRPRAPGGPVQLAVARDGISFYVHASNPVEHLSLAQLQAIYLGDVRNWKDVGGPDAPIVLYSRESSSGTYVFVKQRVLAGQDFTERVHPLPGTAAVVNAVSLERHGIGYGGAAYLRGVKALKLDEDLSRELYFQLAREPTGLSRAFIDYVLSEEGQRLVTDTGFFPVK